MNRVEACNYLRSSGFSDEQIKVIEGAFTCEDAISRREAISIAGIATLSVNQVVTALKKLPSVNPQEPKTGHWIRVDKDKLRCSECEVIHLIAQYPNGKIDYCPNCGAKMQEVKT